MADSSANNYKHVIYLWCDIEYWRAQIVSVHTWYCFAVCPTGGFNFQHVMVSHGRACLCAANRLTQRDFFQSGRNTHLQADWSATNFISLSNPSQKRLWCVCSPGVRFPTHSLTSPAESSVRAFTQYCGDRRKRWSIPRQKPRCLGIQNRSASSFIWFDALRISIFTHARI